MRHYSRFVVSASAHLSPSDSWCEMYLRIHSSDACILKHSVLLFFQEANKQKSKFEYIYIYISTLIFLLGLIREDHSRCRGCLWLWHQSYLYKSKLSSMTTVSSTCSFSEPFRWAARILESCRRRFQNNLSEMVRLFGKDRDCIFLWRQTRVIVGPKLFNKNDQFQETFFGDLSCTLCRNFADWRASHILPQTYSFE